MCVNIFIYICVCVCVCVCVCAKPVQSSVTRPWVFQTPSPRSVIPGCTCVNKHVTLLMTGIRGHCEFIYIRTKAYTGSLAGVSLSLCSLVRIGQSRIVAAERHPGWGWQPTAIIVSRQFAVFSQVCCLSTKIS